MNLEILFIHDTKLLVRAIAQPGSASVWGAGGRGFKSRWPDH